MLTSKILLVNFIFTLCIASCDFKQIDQSILKIGNGADPQTIDPHKCTGMSGLRIISSLFEGLVIRADSGNVAPGVAHSWEQLDSGTTYVFHLRPSIWSNGTPLTAHDFVYSWKRLVNPKTAAQYASLISAVKNAPLILNGKLPSDSLGVSAPNDSTLIVSLDFPQPYFISLCSFEPFFPVHKQTVEKYERDWTAPEKIVSNGPYVLTEKKYKQHFAVKKSPHYWDSQSVSIKEIHFKSVENVNTATAMFKSGELDWTFSIPPFKIERWKDKPEFSSIPQYGVYFYRINHTHPVLKNKKLRKALCYSINRSLITEYIKKGGEEEANNYIPPGIGWFDQENFSLFNQEKALQLLKESGIDPDTLPPIEILYNTSESHKTIAEAIGKMWEDILGIKVTLRNYEWKVFLDALNKYEYAVARGSWIGDYLDPSTFTDIFTSTNGNNRTGFSHERYDSLAYASGLTDNYEQRARLFAQMEEIIIDELPVIPIYFYRNNELRSQRITNITDNLQGLYNYKSITFKESK